MTQRQTRHRPGHWLAALLILAVSVTSLDARTPIQDSEPAMMPGRVAEALRRAADRYRRLQDQWQPVSGKLPLAPGNRSPRVARLRRLLLLYGDYRGPLGPLEDAKTDPQYFDDALQRAVKSYQRRHGLEVTGTADSATLAALAVPPGGAGAAAGTERQTLGKLSLPTEDRYVLINLPDYRLQLVEKGRVRLSMRIVVGKTGSQTPVMTTRITNVIFNPTWTVPRNILLTELLPKARSNPEAMHRHGYRVVSYRSGDIVPISADSLARAAKGSATLRQLSGPENALGRVKFVMPNDQAIFLHDTLAQSLFKLRERAFSHGCVRLEKPEELAYALLNAQGWDRPRVAQTAVSNETVNIKIDKPPRLFIVYMTAWVDSAGRLQFRRDIYHLDRPAAQ